MADKVRFSLSLGAWIILGVLLYAKTFHAPFLFDDEILIVHNPFVQDLAHGAQSLRNIYSYQPSRILTNLTVALNFYFGRLDTFGYHMVNWLLHILVTAGVWYLTRQIIGIKKITALIDVPLWASLLFLVHPLQTESVSYINHRSSLLLTLFFIWSVIFYLKARLMPDFHRRCVLFIACGMCAMLSLLCKESAWPLPLALILCDYMILKQPPKKWVWVALLGFIAVVLLIFELKVKQILFWSVYSQSHRGDYLTLGTYLLTQLRVCVVFLKLIIFPVGLNADYDFAMSKGLFEPQTFVAFVFLSLIIISAYLWRHRCWCWSFCVAWFFISLLGHFVPARYNVIAEHKLYLTLALLTPVVAIWLQDVFKKKSMLVLGVAVAFCAVLTINRNEVWASPVKLWQDTCKKSPQKPRAHLNLASALLQAGQETAAEKIFMKVIAMAPEYCESYINLAQIQTNHGHLEQALAYSNQAIVVNPRFDLAYLQNGFLNDRLNRRADAVKSFKKWLSQHPNDVTIINRIKFLEEQKF